MEHTRARTRIVLCRGQYCNMGRRADQLYKRLEVLVDDLNGEQHPKSIKLEIAACLDMCGAGPNLVIYPDGIVCNSIEEAALDGIFETHVRKRADG
jgi:(2Fe-2S) ferredoxin